MQGINRSVTRDAPSNRIGNSSLLARRRLDVYARESRSTTKSRGVPNKNNNLSVRLRDAPNEKYQTSSSEASADTLETMGSLLEYPVNDPCIVVTETQVMIQG